MNFLKVRILLLLFYSVDILGLFTGIAQADTRSEVQSALESRIQKVLLNYDSQAVAVVSVQFKMADASLPGTPMVFQKIFLRNAANEPILERIQVQAWTTSGEIPPSTRAIIDSIGQSLGPKPELNIRALPEELKQKIPHVTEAPKESNFSGQSVQTLIFGLLAFFMGIILIINGRTLRKVGRELAESLSTQKKSSEEPNEEVAVSRKRDADRDGGAAAPASPSSSSKNLELPDEGALALLSDCYWSGLDRYAAWTWRQMPLRQRQEVLKRSALMGRYVSSWGAVEPEDLGFAEDPAYLTPLPIHELDHSTVSEQVRKSPFLLKSLSRLRAQHLSLNALERIELEILAASSPRSHLSMDWSKVEPSPQRPLASHFTVKISSLEEEEALLGKKDLKPEFKASIPSLGWALELPMEELKTLLKPYSSKELARAWIGTENVLSHFSKAIPEKKLEHIQGHLRSVKPSRDSIEFKTLHAQIVGALKHTGNSMGVAA